MGKCKRCHIDLNHEDKDVCGHCNADLINEFRRNIQTAVNNIKKFGRKPGAYHAEIVADAMGWDAVEDETSGESSIIIYTGIKTQHPVKS